MPEAGRIVAVGGHLHGGANELDPQPAGLRAPHARVATSRSTRPPSDRLYAVRPLLHEPDPKSHQLVAVGDGLRVPQGRAAQGHRGLRQHAPAHAGDGDQPRLRRAAAPGHAGRRAAPPPRRTRSRARRRVRRRAHEAARGAAHAVPRRQGRRARGRPPARDGPPRTVKGRAATVTVRDFAFSSTNLDGRPRRDRPLALPGRRAPRRHARRRPDRLRLAWSQDGRPLRPALHRARPLPADVLPARRVHVAGGHGQTTPPRPRRPGAGRLRR